jgi:hypothetical protein
MSDIKKVQSWDELPPVTYELPGTGAQAYSTRILEKRSREYYELAFAFYEYVCAIPENIKRDLDDFEIYQGMMPQIDLKSAEKILTDRP